MDAAPKTRPAFAVDGKISTILTRLIRKEDRGVFHSVVDTHGPADLVRQTWYSIFDTSRGTQEKAAHRRTIFRILGSMSTAEPMDVIRSWTYPQSEFTTRQVDGMLSRLSKLPKDRYLLLPVMTDGIIPGAFAYDYLRENGMLSNVAFAGYTRKSYSEPRYYDIGRVHIGEQDRRILRQNSSRPIIIVDDVVHKGGTLSAVMSSLVELGVRLDNVKIAHLKKQFYLRGLPECVSSRLI